MYILFSVRFMFCWFHGNWFSTHHVSVCHARRWRYSLFMPLEELTDVECLIDALQWSAFQISFQRHVVQCNQKSNPTKTNDLNLIRLCPILLPYHSVNYHLPVTAPRTSQRCKHFFCNTIINRHTDKCLQCIQPY